MTLCENESTVSCVSEDDDARSQPTPSSCSCSSDLLSPLDSRYSRLSFQSADKRSYRHRVSFDMLTHQPFISFTLRTANEGYQHKSSSRLFMVTVEDPSHLDDDLAAAKLIRYVMDLVDDGDEVVIVGMQCHNLGGGGTSSSRAAGAARPMLSKQASCSSLSDTPTPKQIATQLLRLALDSQHEDKISITVEVALGKPDQALKAMIQLYEPSMLIVGYRKRTRKSMLLGNNTTQAIMNQSLKHTTTSTPVVFVQCQADEQIIQHSHHQHARGHRRTITALSNPLPDKGCHDASLPIASLSQIELGSSDPHHHHQHPHHQHPHPPPPPVPAATVAAVVPAATAIRPPPATATGLVSSTSTGGLAAQFRKTLGLWKR